MELQIECKMASIPAGEEPQAYVFGPDSILLDYTGTYILVDGCNSARSFVKNVNKVSEVILSNVNASSLACVAEQVDKNVLAYSALSNLKEAGADGSIQSVAHKILKASQKPEAKLRFNPKYEPVLLDKRGHNEVKIHVLDGGRKESLDALEKALISGSDSDLHNVSIQHGLIFVLVWSGKHNEQVKRVLYTGNAPYDRLLQALEKASSLNVIARERVTPENMAEQPIASGVSKVKAVGSSATVVSMKDRLAAQKTGAAAPTRSSTTGRSITPTGTASSRRPPTSSATGPASRSTNRSTTATPTAAASRRSVVGTTTTSRLTSKPTTSTTTTSRSTATASAPSSRNTTLNGSSRTSTTTTTTTAPRKPPTAATAKTAATGPTTRSSVRSVAASSTAAAPLAKKAPIRGTTAAAPAPKKTGSASARGAASVPARGAPAKPGQKTAPVPVPVSVPAPVPAPALPVEDSIIFLGEYITIDDSIDARSIKEPNVEAKTTINENEMTDMLKSLTVTSPNKETEDSVVILNSESYSENEKTSEKRISSDQESSSSMIIHEDAPKKPDEEVSSTPSSAEVTMILCNGDSEAKETSVSEVKESADSDVNESNISEVKEATDSNTLNASETEKSYDSEIKASNEVDVIEIDDSDNHNTTAKESNESEAKAFNDSEFIDSVRESPDSATKESNESKAWESVDSTTKEINEYEDKSCNISEIKESTDSETKEMDDSHDNEAADTTATIIDNSESIYPEIVSSTVELVSSDDIYPASREDVEQIAPAQLSNEEKNESYVPMNSFSAEADSESRNNDSTVYHKDSGYTSIANLSQSDVIDSTTAFMKFRNPLDISDIKNSYCMFNDTVVSSTVDPHNAAIVGDITCDSVLNETLEPQEPQVPQVPQEPQEPQEPGTNGLLDNIEEPVRLRRISMDTDKIEEQLANMNIEAAAEQISQPIMEAVADELAREAIAPALEELQASSQEQNEVPVIEEPTAPAHEEVHAPISDEPTAPICEEVQAPVSEEPVSHDVDEPSAPEESAAPVVEELAAPVNEEPIAHDSEEPTVETETTIEEEKLSVEEQTRKISQHLIETAPTEITSALASSMMEGMMNAAAHLASSSPLNDLIEIAHEVKDDVKEGLNNSEPVSDKLMAMQSRSSVVSAQPEDGNVVYEQPDPVIGDILETVAADSERIDNDADKKSTINIFDTSSSVRQYWTVTNRGNGPYLKKERYFELTTVPHSGDKCTLKSLDEACNYFHSIRSKNYILASEDLPMYVLEGWLEAKKGWGNPEMATALIPTVPTTCLSTFTESHAAELAAQHMSIPAPITNSHITVQYESGQEKFNIIRLKL